MIKWDKNGFYGLLEEMTDEQRVYVNSIFSNRLTIVNAKSGSGKTTLAVAAARLLKEYEKKDLLYIFSPVEEDEMGFRPGTQNEKEVAYIQPLKDALLKIGEKLSTAIFNPDLGGKEDFLNKAAWVEAKSHTFARGTNIENKVVIIDEAQNWTVSQLKKQLTRIHDNCTVIVIGHIGQIDLEDHNLSGFKRLIQHFSLKPYSKICKLTKNFRGELANDADELY